MKSEGGDHAQWDANRDAIKMRIHGCWGKEQQDDSFCSHFSFHALNQAHSMNLANIHQVSIFPSLRLNFIFRLSENK